MIGAMIMAHGDDDGLRIPPLLAPTQVIIVPIIRHEQDAEAIYAYCDQLQKQISRKKLMGQNLRVSIDKRDMTGGEKKWYHIKRGVPIRVEVGIKELQHNMVSYSCRNNCDIISKDDADNFLKRLSKSLQGIQRDMLESAREKMSANTRTVTTLEEFKQAFTRKDKLNTFVLAPFIDDKPCCAFTCCRTGSR